jgi:hypothetical protein
MNLESMISTSAGPGRKTFHGMVAIVAATLLLSPSSARPADPGGRGPSGKNPAVKLESLPGTTAKRVILSPKAAERLGIETGEVGEKPIVLKQMVSGLVIPPQEKTRVQKPSGGVFGNLAGGIAPPAPSGGSVFGGFGRRVASPVAQPIETGSMEPKPAGGGFGSLGRKAGAPPTQPVAASAPDSARAVPKPELPASGDVWVLVTLSPAEWDRLEKDKPARLLRLATRDRQDKVVVARPSGLAPMEDMKRSMLSLYYVVPGKDHGLAVNDRMRVELVLSGSREKKKFVPYGAVYYDAKGAAWVYVNTAPLAFERRRIEVDRVVGDLAFLSDGPPVGTPVVTVGAALLFGAEIFGK